MHHQQRKESQKTKRQDFSSGFWSCGKTDHTNRSEPMGVCMCMYTQMDVHTFIYIHMCTYMWCAVFWLVTQLGLTLFATPWMAARQAPLSMGFPRQEYWSGLPFLSPGDLPNPGIQLSSPALVGRFFLPLSHQGKLHTYIFVINTCILCVV